MTRTTEARCRRQHHQTTPSLPLDIVLEIAACSDPATLIRCAATCRDVRRRVADEAFHRRLRLRRTDRFVLPLLVDTTAAEAIQLRKITRDSVLLASRDGLLLLRQAKELRVCDPATGRSQILPAEPSFPGTTQIKRYPSDYVLLVGDSEDRAGTVIFGRPFQVLGVSLELSQHRRYLQLHVFSSENNTWGPYTEIRIPNLHGIYLLLSLDKGLIVGGAVYWLCFTNGGSYVLKLHFRAARVSVSTLPESFPTQWHLNCIMGTTSVRGSLMVLLGDKDKLLAWVQSKQTLKWKQQILVATETIQRVIDNMGVRMPSPAEFYPVWFAARSGVVLVRIVSCGLFWLDLQSMKIVRRLSHAQAWSAGIYCPYEMDLSSWVPTFSSTL